ncbi:MAG TPA: class IV adenylate cyclase [Pyrinomonadaceae bacterium]|nr:class IV adenylate cyclase [Pyrinomonadaceae bacterium]
MIEIEKKYRLTQEQRDVVVQRLREAGAQVVRGEEFEENTIYSGAALRRETSVLRLRRVGERALLTFKERFPSSSAIKHQREEETEVADAEAMAAILEVLGFTPALVYEKRRTTWHFGNVEVVIDELSFGLFMEIEGDEKEIEAAERELGLDAFPAEHSPYPQLAEKHGRRVGEMVEARF